MNDQKFCFKPPTDKTIASALARLRNSDALTDRLAADRVVREAARARASVLGDPLGGVSVTWSGEDPFRGDVAKWEEARRLFEQRDPRARAVYDEWVASCAPVSRQAARQAVAADAAQAMEVSVNADSTLTRPSFFRNALIYDTLVTQSQADHGILGANLTHVYAIETVGHSESGIRKRRNWSFTVVSTPTSLCTELGPTVGFSTTKASNKHCLTDDAARFFSGPVGNRENMLRAVGVQRIASNTVSAEVCRTVRRLLDAVKFGSNKVTRLLKGMIKIERARATGYVAGEVDVETINTLHGLWTASQQGDPAYVFCGYNVCDQASSEEAFLVDCCGALAPSRDDSVPYGYVDIPADGTRIYAVHEFESTGSDMHNVVRRGKYRLACSAAWSLLVGYALATQCEDDLVVAATVCGVLCYPSYLPCVRFERVLSQIDAVMPAIAKRLDGGFYLRSDRVSAWRKSGLITACACSSMIRMLSTGKNIAEKNEMVHSDKRRGQFYVKWAELTGVDVCALAYLDVAHPAGITSWQRVVDTVLLTQEMWALPNAVCTKGSALQDAYKHAVVLDSKGESVMNRLRSWGAVNSESSWTDVVGELREGECSLVHVGTRPSVVKRPAWINGPLYNAPSRPERQLASRWHIGGGGATGRIASVFDVKPVPSRINLPSLAQHDLTIRPQASVPAVAFARHLVAPVKDRRQVGDNTVVVVRTPHAAVTPPVVLQTQLVIESPKLAEAPAPLAPMPMVEALATQSVRSESVAGSQKGPAPKLTVLGSERYAPNLSGLRACARVALEIADRRERVEQYVESVQPTPPTPAADHFPEIPFIIQHPTQAITDDCEWPKDRISLGSAVLDLKTIVDVDAMDRRQESLLDAIMMREWKSGAMQEVARQIRTHPAQTRTNKYGDTSTSRDLPVPLTSFMYNRRAVGIMIPSTGKGTIVRDGVYACAGDGTILDPLVDDGGRAKCKLQPGAMCGNRRGGVSRLALWKCGVEKPPDSMPAVEFYTRDNVYASESLKYQAFPQTAATFFPPVNAIEPYCRNAIATYLYARELADDMSAKHAVKDNREINLVKDCMIGITSMEAAMALDRLAMGKKWGQRYQATDFADLVARLYYRLRVGTGDYIDHEERIADAMDVLGHPRRLDAFLTLARESTHMEAREMKQRSSVRVTRSQRGTPHVVAARPPDPRRNIPKLPPIMPGAPDAVATRRGDYMYQLNEMLSRAYGSKEYARKHENPLTWANYSPTGFFIPLEGYTDKSSVAMAWRLHDLIHAARDNGDFDMYDHAERYLTDLGKIAFDNDCSQTIHKCNGLCSNREIIDEVKLSNGFALTYNPRGPNFFIKNRHTVSS